MEIVSERFRFEATRTFSDVSVDGVRRCYALEDRVRETPDAPVSDWKVPGETAIPVGRYRVSWDFSPHFGREMIHLNDVPGFVGIRVHSGVDEADTDGCLILGDVISAKGISGGKLRGVTLSVEALVRGAIEAGEEVWWEVRGLPGG